MSRLDPPDVTFLEAGLRWSLVLLWAGGIFIYSGRSNPLGSVARSAHSGLIGRALHIGEYTGLTTLLTWALASRHDKERLPKRILAYAFGLALAYALFDELHQSFVPGRTCTLVDIGYDLVGGSSGRWAGFGRFFIAGSAEGPGD